MTTPRPESTPADRVSDPGQAQAIMLELDDVCVAYKHHEVVHDVSLQVATGEVIAIIGPSGAGKSSLLRSVNFLEPPSKGRVIFQDKEISAQHGRRALDAVRRDIGMVFQSFNLFPHLTAMENIMLAQVHARGRSKEEAKQRALQELESVGLASHANSRPAKCSGGQQQRIAIARALALDPKIMLFDEPTSALDPELGADVLATMRRLADAGMTMLICTHEMHFAEDVADRIVFMADGRIVEQGPARQLMRDPQHERTKRFLSAVRER
jgi:polar amino acid transport system ATP-binding protein